MRRLLRWRILLPAVAVAFLVLSMTQALERGASISPEPTVPPGASDRQALRLEAANRAADSFLADPTDLQGSHRVLVSFEQGMNLPEALRRLREADGGLKVVALHYSVVDSAGTRHTIGISAHEGEDLELTAPARVASMVESIREIARKALSEGLPTQDDGTRSETWSGGCSSIKDDRACEALVAQSNISDGAAELNGMTIMTSDQGLRDLLNRKDELGILAVEAAEGGVFTSPIVAGGE